MCRGGTYTDLSWDATYDNFVDLSLLASNKVSVISFLYVGNSSKLLLNKQVSQRNELTFVVMIVVGWQHWEFFILFIENSHFWNFKGVLRLNS